MNMFSKMKLVTKLFGSFVIVLALMAGLGAYAISQLATVNSSTVELASNWLPSVRNALNVKSNLNRLRVLQYKTAADQDPAAIAEDEKAIAEKSAGMRTNEDDYAKLISIPEEKQLFESYKVE